MSSGTYSVTAYGSMIRAEPRMTAYSRALRHAITPGCTVLDLGAGFGFFAILACSYGAGRVVAVEPAESIQLGTEMARANGCADQIDFVQGLSSDLAADNQFDVIIADLRGCLPLFKRHIPVIIDARQRLLKPGGTLVTQRDTLCAALVSDNKICEKTHVPWRSNDYNVDLSTGSQFAVNHPHRNDMKPGMLFSDVGEIAVLDYRTITDPNVSGKVSLTAHHDATAHGFAAWFDAELCDGRGFSTAPDAPPLVYGQMFFPFKDPIELEKDDRVEIDIDFQLVGDEYVKTWRTRRISASPDAPEIRFVQSSTLAEVTSIDTLRRRSGGYAPPPHPRHELDRHCLQRFDGETKLETIALELMEMDSERFEDTSDALRYVAALAERYHLG